MRAVISCCGCYAAFVLQASIAEEIALEPYTPQFLMLALAIAVSRLPPIPGLVCAAVLGLLSDALAPEGLGIDVICFTLAALGLQQLPWFGRIKSTLVLCLQNFAIVFVVSLVTACLRAGPSGFPGDWLKCLDLASGCAGYTALLGASLGIALTAARRLVLPARAWRTGGGGWSLLSS